MCEIAQSKYCGSRTKSLVHNNSSLLVVRYRGTRLKKQSKTQFDNCTIEWYIGILEISDDGELSGRLAVRRFRQGFSISDYSIGFGGSPFAQAPDDRRYSD